MSFRRSFRDFPSGSDTPVRHRAQPDSLLRLSLPLMLLLLPACQSSPRMPPGASALSLSVEANPKQGAPQTIQRLYVYDTPLAAKPAGDYERVDYSNLSD